MLQASIVSRVSYLYYRIFVYLQSYRPSSTR